MAVLMDHHLPRHCLPILTCDLLWALGIHFGLSACYYVLLTVGSTLGVFAGFASFCAKQPLIVLEQDDWRVEIDTEQWTGILQFLQESVWAPTMPAQRLGCVVTPKDASGFSYTGQRVMAEAANDPMSF